MQEIEINIFFLFLFLWNLLPQMFQCFVANEQQIDIRFMVMQVIAAHMKIDIELN